MTAHDWFVEHRTEFAAQLLEPDATSAFAAHLETCEACRVAVAQIQAELSWLPMGVTPVAPREGFAQQALHFAVDTREAGRHTRRWAVPIGIAASLISGLAGWQFGQQRADPAVAPAVAVAPAQVVDDAQLIALRDTVSIMRQAARVMQAKIMMKGKEGGMVIFADATTHRWNVVVHGLPPAPADGRYQFWFITSDGMVRGASVNVDPQKPMMFTTGMPTQGRGDVLGAALTIEPIESDDGPPRGKTLAHLML